MHGGKNYGAGARLVWRPGLEAAWRGRRAYIEKLHALGFKAPGGRRPKLWREKLSRREGVAEMADEVLQLTPVAVGSSDADRMLEVWRLGISHCMAILRAPGYVPGEDIKWDRLVYEMTQGLGNQLVRIGEGLIQREKADKLTGLLERLKASEAQG